MRSWKDRFPERFEHELSAFAERDLDFKLDEDLLEEQGRVVLRGTLVHDGDEIPLEVNYPDLFPYLRPEVVAKELKLDRHQNPYEGNLCLLDRSSRAWNPSDTGAWLVAERVPYLLKLLAAGGEELRKEEAPQGEPVSSYFPSAAGTVIFVPAEALKLPPDTSAGSGRIACSSLEPPQLRIRGLIGELVEKKRNRKTRTLARADASLQTRFSGATLSFRWARLDARPVANTPEALLDAIEAARPGFGSPPWERVHGGQVAIAGAVFSEEVRQGEEEDAWVFAVKVRQDQGPEGAYLIRGQRLSREDLEARLPAFVRMGERTISLSGLGALGGEIAVELAKTGLGTLRGLDFDTVDAGTTVRWAGGLTAVGHLKAEYLRQRIEYDYPYTTFEAFPHQIGSSASLPTARQETELDVLDRFFENSDLLIDATAEIGVQQALAAEASALGIRQIYVSATEGARGGLVARIDPERGGCWLCLQWHLEDGSIPLPAREEALTLQPRGCASLTYTGTGYDLLPICAQAVRVATATLADQTEPAGSDVFICSFEEDRLLPPIWATYPLRPHPKCPICAQNDQ
jgi:hypothetical protein